MPFEFDPSWAMERESIEYIRGVIREFKPQRVLELGSGLTTVELGPEVAEYGGQWDALEHDVAYAWRVIDAIEVFGVYVWPAEIKHKFYQWPEGLFETDMYDMLIVDGPPSSIGDRSLAVPKFYDWLNPGAFVFLDDAVRPDEFVAFQQWARDYDWEYVALRTTGRGLAELRKTSG